MFFVSLKQSINWPSSEKSVDICFHNNCLCDRRVTLKLDSKYCEFFVLKNAFKTKTLYLLVKCFNKIYR